MPAPACRPVGDVWVFTYLLTQEQEGQAAAIAPASAKEVTS